MARFFTPKTTLKSLTPKRVEVLITHLDYLGAGIATYLGKKLFVPLTLPGDLAVIEIIEDKKNYSKGKLIEIKQPSFDRIEAPCRHYALCGGCDLQHSSVENQRIYKEDCLNSLLANALKEFDIDYTKEPMLVCEQWQYRRRVKFAVKLNKNLKFDLGFRAKNSSQIVNIKECMILDSDLNKLIKPVFDTLQRITKKHGIGHIELIKADNGIFLLIRCQSKLNATDSELLLDLAQEHNLQIALILNDNNLYYLTPKLDAYYELDNLRLTFLPDHFIQINANVNKLMVEQAVNWLEIEDNDEILDLFCGIGNFSLALAKKCKSVIGIEGVDKMVTCGQKNSIDNKQNVKFIKVDLDKASNIGGVSSRINKIVVDPSRIGIYDCIDWIVKIDATHILYVACSPMSLARDSKELAKKGYNITKFGLIDMFPQTHHIEAMALFTKQ